jgi:hypothetical protein
LLAETGFAGTCRLLDWRPQFAAFLFVKIVPIRFEERRYPSRLPAKPKT